MKRVLVLAGMLLVVVMFLTACTTEPGTIVETVVVTKEVVITATPEPEPEPGEVDLRFTIFTGDKTQQAVLNEIGAAYTELHPNVNIQFEFVPYGDYTTKLTLQLSGTKPPDAGWIVERWAPTWLGAGVLADMGPALKSDPDYNFEDFSQSALGLWTEGEAVYGIPFSTSPFLILYNKDLFEAAGVDTPDVLLANGEWTWEKVAEIGRVIKEETGEYGEVEPGLYARNYWNIFIPVMRAYGGEVWGADNTCMFNSPGSVEAVQLIHDMIYVDQSMAPPGEEVDFYSGGAGLTIGQLSRVARLQDAPFEWGIALLPSGPVGYHSVIGQAGIVVFNASKHRDVAIDFVKFLTNAENSTKLAQFWPTARMSVLRSDAMLEANPLIDAETMQTVVVEAIEKGFVASAHPEYSQITLAVDALVDTLWSPDADVEAVMDSICEAIGPILQR